MQEQPLFKPVNNYELKTEKVSLVPVRSKATDKSVSLSTLEAMHSGPAVSASKFGLETICGASCDTGAQ